MARTTLGLRRKKNARLQSPNRLRVSAQLLRRNNKDAPPQTIAARTDERVRDQPAHAVAEHDDVSRREIVIVRIDDRESSARVPRAA